MLSWSPSGLLRRFPTTAEVLTVLTQKVLTELLRGARPLLALFYFSVMPHGLWILVLQPGIEHMPPEL